MARQDRGVVLDLDGCLYSGVESAFSPTHLYMTVSDKVEEIAGLIGRLSTMANLSDFNGVLAQWKYVDDDRFTNCRLLGLYDDFIIIYKIKCFDKIGEPIEGGEDRRSWNERQAEVRSYWQSVAPNEPEEREPVQEGVQYVICKECGAEILQTTADTCNGRCVVCFEGERPGPGPRIESDPKILAMYEELKPFVAQCMEDDIGKWTNWSDKSMFLCMNSVGVPLGENLNGYNYYVIGTFASGNAVAISSSDPRVYYADQTCCGSYLFEEDGVWEYDVEEEVILSENLVVLAEDRDEFLHKLRSQDDSIML